MEQPKYVSWSSSNSVGHAGIDAEHQRMLKIINDTFVLFKEAKGDQKQKQKAALVLLDQIVKYTKEHFASEEKILKSVGYPDAENHMKIHSEMATRTEIFKSEYLSNPNYDTTQDLLSFLRDWWLNHISKVDKNYSDYL